MIRRRHCSALTTTVKPAPRECVPAPALAATPWTSLSPVAWSLAVYAALVGSGVGAVIWYVGVRRFGASRTTIDQDLQPVLAVAIAAIVLGERLSPAQLAGAAIVIAGVALAR